MPLCNPMCNTGTCINDNICDCRNTKFKGKLCNERYQLKRLDYIDVPILFICILLIFVKTILIFCVLKYRKEKIIKAGIINIYMIY